MKQLTQFFGVWESDFNGSFSAPEKMLSVKFNKANTTFCLSLHYNHNNSYLFVNGKEICKLKVYNQNINFLVYYCVGRISNGFYWV